MSFALSVKEELSRIKIDKIEDITIYLEGLFKSGLDLVFSNDFKKKLIYHSRSNTIIRNIIKYVTSTLKAEYELYQRQIMRFDKPIIYYLEIVTKVEEIIKNYHLFDEDSLHKDLILDNENYRNLYLRGAFITLGSINDPNTSKYHLEFNCNNQSEALFIQNLINTYNFNARISKRRENFIVYIKEIEVICDLLRIIGATNTVFYIEDKIIKRNMVTSTKRSLNFEIANQQRAYEAALGDLKYIRYLEYNYPLEKLDPKLLMVMKVRKENPEVSLSELANIINETYNMTISKSGISHRLRKIKELALEHRAARKE